MHKFRTHKPLLVYAIISFALFMIVFGIFTQVISNHFTKTLKNDLINEATEIGNDYVDACYTKDYDLGYFDYKFQFLSEQYETHTVITNSKGIVLLDSLKDHDYCLDAENISSLVKDTTKGSIIVEEGSDHNQFGNPTFSIGVPIMRKGLVYCVVVMHAPLPKTNSTIFFIYRITFITLITALSLAFLYTLIFSNQTNRTLEALNKTSKEVANGNFASRVDVTYAGQFGELANNMNDMAEELGKLEAMRKDFIANISHDIRSPLTSIKGFVQAILDGTIPYENQDKYLNIVLDETERLSYLTNNILLLTKMENQQVLLEKSSFELHQIIRKVLLQFDQHIITKKMEVKLLFHKKDLVVFADTNQIQRVLYNLIDNAIKFSNLHGKLIIETTVIKDKAEISISDSGQGIPDDSIKYIWDRFHKVDRSRGKDKKGIGIGLSIVKEIIKAHDERIDVNSQLGKGTKFTFTLPLSTSKNR
ncbi:MAG: hypothetical protein CVU84_17025 [Firmicutes bacterium HGW-Firmicutes-1]|jgi:signal transduction histidine kinase|nr:MAG: hypothetical protein CVU84_17025 [Firmicutes bacterium HGW-Firmicutes-1]